MLHRDQDTLGELARSGFPIGAVIGVRYTQGKVLHREKLGDAGQAFSPWFSAGMALWYFLLIAFFLGFRHSGQTQTKSTLYITRVLLLQSSPSHRVCLGPWCVHVVSVDEPMSSFLV